MSFEISKALKVFSEFILGDDKINSADKQKIRSGYIAIQYIL
jgi:hypothetical protein